MKTLDVDKLLSFTKERFDRFDRFNDKRAANQQYNIGDCLQSGLAIFHLKDSSLLEFHNRFSQRIDNLLRIYKISKSPSDTHLRLILDRVNPIQIERVKRAIIQELRATKLLEEFEIFPGWKLLLVDGVHHFSSKKVHCEYCCQRQHKDGTTTFSHAMLASVIAHPDKKEVLSLSEEPIIQQDGVTKNDCELNAAKRLVTKVQTRFLSDRFIWVQDALYSNGPHIRNIQSKGHRFITRVKKGSAAGATIKQYEAIIDAQFIKPAASFVRCENKEPIRLSAEQLQDFDNYKRRKKLRKELTESPIIYELTKEEKNCIKTWHFVNGLYLNDEHPDIKVNFIRYQEEVKGKEKPSKTFDWITDIPLTPQNIIQVSRAGRSRWMIENETFNTLKNQGYHFEHNFGHGQEYLCTNFALLMMMAFLIDQIQQLKNSLFNQAIKSAKRKKYLWEDVRSFMRTLPFDSMEMIYNAIIYGPKAKFLSVQQDSS